MLRRYRIASQIVATAMLGGLIVGCHGSGGSFGPSGLQRDAAGLRDWGQSVARVATSMEQQGIIPSALHPELAAQVRFPGPYYLHVMAPGSTFLEEARQSLERELLQRGATVARVPDGATVLNLDIDVVSRGASVGRSLLAATDTEAAWRITIVTDDSVVMKSGENLVIAAEDAPLFSGGTTIAPLASPGMSLIGAARVLRYAR